MNGVSFWHAEGGAAPGGAPALAPLASALPERCDVAVVGGGLAGLASAARMLEMAPGLRLVLLEAEHVGWGASGRNGGLLSPLAVPLWLVTAARNGEHAWGLRRLNSEARRLLGEIADRWPGCAPEPATLALEAMGPITSAGLGQVVAALEATGIAHASDRAGGLRRRGTVSLAAGTVQPYRLVLALAEWVRAGGGTILEGARVGAIERGPGGATLQLADGRRLAATTVVVATNAYTDSLAGLGRVRARAIYNHMLASAPLDAATLARLPPAGTFTVALDKHYVFFRLFAGRLVLGGIDKVRHAAPSDLLVPAKVEKALLALAARSLAGSGVPPITHMWAGRYHATATEVPIIRRDTANPAVLLAVGYGGTGIVLTLATAGIVAAEALGQPEGEADARLHAAMRETRLPLAGGLRLAAAVARDLVLGRAGRLGT
jgi:glycine/D-amino acid oxidase-like deaminating enzyme